jgi:hypothetical protein
MESKQSKKEGQRSDEESDRKKKFEGNLQASSRGVS